MSVHILMATHNGEKYLQDQLDSLIAQTYTDWMLTVSDDGSTDGTKKLLKRFISTYPNKIITIVDTTARGFCSNFLDLIFNPAIDGKYIALCDQDDVWLPDKLQLAVCAIEKFAPAPAVYCGAKIVCGPNLTPKHGLQDPVFTASFTNAMCQNIASGNTILLNDAALNVLRSRPNPNRLIMFHDWWIYQVMSGLGHRVIYDPTPQILYRQHSSNSIGAGFGAKAFMKRAGQVVMGRYRRTNRHQWAGITPFAKDMPPQNRRLFADIANTTQTGWYSHLSTAYKYGLHRQTKLGTLLLYLTIALGRF